MRRLTDLVLALGLLVLLAVVAMRFERVESQELAGQVRLSDGDSLVLAGRRLRLRGIDAPELTQTCSRQDGDYACGKEALDMLHSLIGGRAVVCRGWEEDRYGRLLVHCMAGDTDLNARMVSSGWAVSYGDYNREESEARRASRGLWTGDFQPPSQWRAVHGAMAESEHDMIEAFMSWLRQLVRWN